MPNSVDRLLRDIYDRLWDAYGPQGWWPADSAIEVVVGAILTQNTAWSNVERAISNLKSAGCLSWTALRDISEEKLGKLIQPSGTFRVKAGRLKAFAQALWSEHNGSLDSILGVETRRSAVADRPSISRPNDQVDAARRRLLAIRGIGPETADAILLYAAHRPTFVVDAYTRRILRRHHLIDAGTDYETVRQMFHRALPQERAVKLYNEYHALFVAVGKKHCRARARCDGCPLADQPHDPDL
ncbi:MAG: endonuclease III domain-containing protein [Planctomycetota bacterium]|jgi:endonuclease-3 related protein